MKIKKNIIQFKSIAIWPTITPAIFMLILMFMASCSESILDKQPLSDISDENIFNDDVLMESYVNGTYRVFRFFQFGAFYTEGLQIMRRIQMALLSVIIEMKQHPIMVKILRSLPGLITIHI